jgi:hypothetical protein
MLQLRKLFEYYRRLPMASIVIGGAPLDVGVPKRRIGGATYTRRAVSGG